MCADTETENSDMQVIEGGERAPEPRAPWGKNGGGEGFAKSLFELDPNPVRKGRRSIIQMRAAGSCFGKVTGKMAKKLR